MSHVVPATPTLYLLCGKVAAGKSTLAQQLSAPPGVILLSEDDWLSCLYPGEIRTLDDYVQRAGRLRAAVAPHVARLLRAGLSVVLDFPANTVNQRRWMKALIVDSGVAHELHYLDLPDAVCRARLHARNAGGDHPFITSDEAFDAITRHFAPPGESEGFHVIRQRQPGDV